LTIFFAGGNGGGNGVGTSTITMEASSKNVIAVASGHSTLGSANISYIAFYSSKGPTYDGRVKPDIVSPGHQLLSAKSAGTNSQTCDTIQMTGKELYLLTVTYVINISIGTSMASPAAAGIAALVRQYFSDNSGRFWTAVCCSSYRSCKSFNPTGYFIKAILIHSAVRMTLYNGGGAYDVPLGRPPDYMQGFGRVALYNVLPLKGVYTNFDLFVADAVNIPEDTSISFSVKITNGKQPLRYFFY
jgi:hypothetical protein